MSRRTRRADHRRIAAVAVPLLVASAAYVAAGGYVHLRAWVDLYRHLPAGYPGAGVVQIGFPVTAMISAVFAALVAVCVLLPFRLVPIVLAGAVISQVGALAALVISRTGSLFGWTEATWSGAAGQAGLTEVGALLCLSGAIAMATLARRDRVPTVMSAVVPSPSADRTTERAAA